MNYNFLIIPDRSIIPFPPEIEPLIANENWEEFLWNSSGFKDIGATYSILENKYLYLENDAAGETKIQKSDFSGEAFFGGYFFNSDKEGSNYLVAFKIIFLKGMIVEVTLHESKPQSASEFDTLMNQSNDAYAIRLKREITWWFKYLYKPYRKVIHCIALCTIYPLYWADCAVRKIALWITPY